MENDDRFKERAYERLYQLYEKLSSNFMGLSLSMTHSSDLDEVKRKLTAFSDIKQYDNFGILSREDMAEIGILEKCLFGESRFSRD